MEDRLSTICTGLMIVSLCFMSWFLTRDVLNSLWEYQAIKHRVAHYDAVTAQFTWNIPVEVTSQDQAK